MRKPIFTSVEAQLVAFKENPKLVNLQLHQWRKNGDLVQLKRGLYAFKEREMKPANLAKSLYSPCYFSLDFILSLAGIMAEAVFAYTLVTPKPTRCFETPYGNFYYHTIKKEAFTGYDPQTLMAEKEKALVDYFYLNSGKLKADNRFWEESRLEVVETEVNFKKVYQYAKLLHSTKLLFLLKHFEQYAKSHETHRGRQKKERRQ